MTKGNKIEEVLDYMAQMPIPANGLEACRLLQPYLAEKRSRVVTMAARLCADHLVYDAIPDLVNACRRFMMNGAKTDKNCMAKKALCQSLYTLDYSDRDFYLQGMNCRQLEPVWGGAVDTAADIRIICAQGITLSRDLRVAADLLPLLYDEIASVRMGAIKAVSLLRADKAELILKQKVLQGDEEPSVVGECFHALLAVDPDTAVEFIVRYLYVEDEAIVQEAAMALGIASSQESWQALLDCWQGMCCVDISTRHIIRGFALHRLPEALDLLLDMIVNNHLGMARCAIEMLHQYRHTQKLHDELADLLAGIAHQDQRQWLQEVWKR